MINRYVYIFYRYYQGSIHEYNSFEDALRRFKYDFDYGEAYSIGIYDREAKILHVPYYFGEEQHNLAIEETKKLGYEIEEVQSFEF